MECVLYLAPEHIPTHPLSACCWADRTASRKISGGLSSDFCYVVQCFFGIGSRRIHSKRMSTHMAFSKGNSDCMWRGWGDHNESEAALRTFQGGCRTPTQGNNQTWPCSAASRGNHSWCHRKMVKTNGKLIHLHMSGHRLYAENIFRPSYEKRNTEIV